MTSQQHAELWETLYRYWQSKHAAGQPPRRSDIDPMIDIPHLASNLIMIEVRPTGAQYRLIGSDVVDHFGVDQTGKAVGASNIDPKQLIMWRQAVEAVSADGKPHMLVSRYTGADRSQTIALVMPLTPDADGVTKILGAAFFGQPFPVTDDYPSLTVRDVVLDL